MEPHPATARPRHRRYARLRAAVAAVVVAALAAGCGVRLETPPPSEPVPDALEVVRRTAVADALLVAEQAESVAATADEDLRTELEQVAGAARRHAEELGGVYDSGLEEPTPDASPEPSQTADPLTAQDVVLTLTDAAARSRSAASTTTDGPLARLLASVGASQTVSATRLAGLAGAEPPAPVVPQIPVPTSPGTDEADGTGDPEGEDGTETAGEAAPADGASDSPVPSPTGTPGPSPSAGSTPQGLRAADLEALVAGEDATGYALRRRAALAEDRLRERLLARAEVHRARGEAWAVLAGTDGTEQDPRRVAYAVPARDELDDAALVQTLEADLAADYASLVARSAPGTRAVLVELLVDGALAVDAWGGAARAFPGLPEQAED